MKRTEGKHGGSRSDSPERTPSELRRDVSPARLRGTLLVLCALVVYEVLESALWGRILWGAHFYSFWPHWTWFAAVIALAACNPWKLGTAVVARPVSVGLRTWLPWTAGVASVLVFWLLRERHLFWGDSLPLSILVPQGQAFHPDEPLTLFAHQLLFDAGGGRWSGATAVAIGSVLAGFVFVTWSLHWFLRRTPDTPVALLAAATLCTQGFVMIFFGHVENYSYLAVCLLFFFTWGVDFLDGRVQLFRPLFAGLAAFAFHILGGLTVVPALLLVMYGLRDPERRRSSALAVLAIIAIAIAAATAASSLYEGESPWGRFVGGAFKIFGNPIDSQGSHIFTWRRLGDLWSEQVLLGPLSLCFGLVLLAVLGSSAFLRRAKGAFLLIGALALLGPSLFVGQGNLGAARNWDLFAAPAVASALLVLLRITQGMAVPRARRLLVAVLAVSVFHTAPWIALNGSLERSAQRVAGLPLGGGRGSMVLGTHYLNAGDLSRAETWFRGALNEDSTNVNAQSGLGLALARQGDFHQALVPMTTAVRLKPASLQFRRDRLALLVQLELWPEVIGEAGVVLGQDPYDRRSWVTLALAWLGSDAPDSAALALETGLHYVPADPEMEHLLAVSYEHWVVAHGRRSEWAAARAALARFEARFPDDPRVERFKQVLP